MSLALRVRAVSAKLLRAQRLNKPGNKEIIEKCEIATPYLDILRGAAQQQWCRKHDFVLFPCCFSNLGVRLKPAGGEGAPAVLAPLHLLSAISSKGSFQSRPGKFSRTECKSAAAVNSEVGTFGNRSDG